MLSLGLVVDEIADVKLRIASIMMILELRDLEDFLKCMSQFG